MASKLPRFQPVKVQELRSIWTRHSDPDIQCLVLEVVRYRDVMAEIDQLYKTTHQAWRDTNGGNLITLHLLQELMTAERERLAF